MWTKEEQSFSKLRRYPRLSVDIQVGLLDGSRFSFERAVELSEGGLLLKVGKRPVNGHIIDVSFLLPGGTFVSTSAEAVYGLEPQGGEIYAGLRFLHLSPAMQGLIRDYVEAVRSRS